MYLPLIILIVIASILLSFIVLIQNSKGGGLSSGFASSNQIMGVRKTTSFLEKATWGLAAFIIILSIATTYVVPNNADNENSELIEEAQKNEQTNPLNTPAGFATPTKTDDANKTAPQQSEQKNAQPNTGAAQTPATNKK